MKILLIPAMCIMLLGCQSSMPTAKRPESRTRAGEDEGRNVNSQPYEIGEEHDTNPTFIGVVESGVFKMVLPKSVLIGRPRLTGIAMQEARPPETGELDLSQYEGTAIAIQGHNGGGWIYSARVVDTGGPIVTALVQQELDQ